MSIILAVVIVFMIFTEKTITKKQQTYPLVSYMYFIIRIKYLN